MKSTFVMSRCCLLVGLPLLLVAIGCGEGSNTQTVTGSVSYQDQPLNSGAVAFFPGESRPIQAKINQGGGYTAELPPGEYKVTVIVGLDLPPDWKEGDPTPPPAVRLPPQYASRLRTPLTASVAPDQTEPIDFKL